MGTVYTGHICLGQIDHSELMIIMLFCYDNIGPVCLKPRLNGQGANIKPVVVTVWGQYYTL